jgi:hypothetical protein
MTVMFRILPTIMHKPSEMAHTVVLLTCIWMLPIVNLSWYKDYLTSVFQSHSQSLQENSRLNHNLVHHHFLPYMTQYILH